MKKQNVRTLSLIVVTITYLLIGGAIFDSIESKEEIRQREALTIMESQILQKYNITQDDFNLFEEVVLLYKPYKAGMPWQFAGSFYYATTVLTTIGYGHSTPKTMWGRLFTMVYALFGIPLGLVLFNSIGERLNRFSSMIIDKIRRVVKAKQQETTEVDLIMVVMFLSLIITMTGATVFSYYERWEFFDSLYYCFATLTTIGFGDLVALQQDNALQSQPEYVIFALFFIMFGLAMIAALLNLILLKFMTMNTEDENRDEIEALEAARMTVKLDGDIIMGEIVADKRYAASFGGSDEDLRSVCSCNCVSCHPGVSLFPGPARGKRFFLRGNRSGSPCVSPPPVYSDYYQSPPRSRPESVHDIRSCDYDGLSLLATFSRTSPRPSVMEEAVSHITVSHASSQFRVHSRQDSSRNSGQVLKEEASRKETMIGNRKRRKRASL